MLAIARRFLPAEAGFVEFILAVIAIALATEVTILYFM
jgi:hypothetical protein